LRQAIDVGASRTDAEVYRIYDAVTNGTIPQGLNIPNDQGFVNELRLIGQAVASDSPQLTRALKPCWP
jgi:multiple sugar transport system substrate-binding protein